MIKVQHELYYPVNGIVTKVNEKLKFNQIYPFRPLNISSNRKNSLKKMYIFITFVLLANFSLDAAMLPPLPSILSDTFPSYPFVGEKIIEEKHE